MLCTNIVATSTGSILRKSHCALSPRCARHCLRAIALSQKNAAPVTVRTRCSRHCHDARSRNPQGANAAAEVIIPPATAHEMPSHFFDNVRVNANGRAPKGRWPGQWPTPHQGHLPRTRRYTHFHGVSLVSGVPVDRLQGSSRRRQDLWRNTLELLEVADELLRQVPRTPFVFWQILPQ